MGYYRAGFDVIGVDIEPQPRYPFEFVQADAIEFLAVTGHEGFAAIHASPPCQAYTKAQKINDNSHPDLVGPVRELLVSVGLPYVIENVPGAPLLPFRTIELCGVMFGLGTYRHRLFETGDFAPKAPEHKPHSSPVTKMGRRPKDGEFMHIVGNFSGVTRAREAMGIGWMTRDGLREAVPPAYTEYIGKQLIAALRKEAA